MRLNTKYLLLKFLLIGLVAVLFVISQAISALYYQKPLVLILLDTINTMVITVIAIEIAFYLLTKKDQELQSQIDQVCEAYQYIGQMNRKLDALLELDISTLDHSKKLPTAESFSAIFLQLINLLQAQAGYLHLKPPVNIKLFEQKNKDLQLKKVLDNIMLQDIKDFKYSGHSVNENFFQNLAIPADYLNKYHFVTKPIYMHDQDIAIMILAFKKNSQLEDRDLNIIRVFSFYLALNATFKPDFTPYQT